MESRLILKASDLQKVSGTSDRNAKRILAHLRDALGKKRLKSGRFQDITIPEYCQYAGIDLSEFCKTVKISLPK
jgi:hypothetical protein